MRGTTKDGKGWQGGFTVTGKKFRGFEMTKMVMGVQKDMGNFQGGLTVVGEILRWFKVTKKVMGV